MQYQQIYSNNIIEFTKTTGKPLRAYSTQINVPYSILIKWAHEYPEFGLSFELAMSHYLNYWLDILDRELASVAPDASIITIAKSNVDRYYKETDSWYEALETKDKQTSKDSNSLSETTGASMKW